MTDLPSTPIGEVDELDDPVMLDVREADEFAAGHAPGAIHHPLGTLPEIWSSLPAGRTILCICRSGARSGQATVFLREQGLVAVNLEGGMQAWDRFGLEVVDDRGTSGTVI
jgi:rhodanese-related sulfurtransferase